MRLLLSTLCVATISFGCGTARYADTAPSAGSLEALTLLEESDLEIFTVKWLVPKGARRVSPRDRAATEFAILVQPPMRPGYRSIGMRDGDDATQVFDKWCKARGAESLYSFQVVWASPPKESLKACVRGSSLIGSMGYNQDRESKDGSVTVTVFFFTPTSIAKAGELKQKEAVAEYESRIRAQQTVAIFQRDIDAIYRSRLKAGDYASWAGTLNNVRINGLVVELKVPLALVQFPDLRPNTTIWVRVDELGEPRR